MSNRLQSLVRPLEWSPARRAGLLSLAVAAAFAMGSGEAVAQGRAQAKAQPQAPAKEFTHSPQSNAEWARRLGIPVYFALPSSARLPLPQSINTTDRLIDFKHPDTKSGDVGLRIVAARRAGMGRRLAQAGLLQTGDIVLTFRPEWGGGGAYPNIQMGVSHAGLVYVKDGTAHQIDNPLDAEYLGPQFRGDFTGGHYGTLKFLHVIRPRELTEAQRETLTAWATRLNGVARKAYPQQISFNQDYNAPKYKSGKQLDFVHQLGRIALGQPTTGKIDLFCSEFVWSLLALRNCDPAGHAEDFKGSKVPSCISAIMPPLRVTGSYATRRGRSSDAGLADGPLLIVDSLKLATAEREALIHNVFVEDKTKLAKMSAGHRKLAQDLSPKFAPLEQYYKGATAGVTQRLQAWYISSQFRRAIPDNYSPTSFLINTLLPASNTSRSMDYVATISLE